jgi:hypothetical protein
MSNFDEDIREFPLVLLVIACDKREAFVQESAAKQSISPLAAAWIASLRSQ